MDASPGGFTIGVDIGGTFTDAVAVSSDGHVWMAKAPTTPADLCTGFLDALTALAQQVGVGGDELLRRTRIITHGSTIATNAILTRSGATVGLITTRGFEDTAYIMRAVGRVDGLAEADVRHAAAVTKPVPLVRRAAIVGVRERIDVRGEVVVNLNLADVRSGIDRLLASGCDSLAVCLLNSWANPVHEERVMDELARLCPQLYTSASSRLVRLAGEYARTNTVVVDAYVGPMVQGYVARLEAATRQRGFGGEFLLMQGHGGLATAAECRPVATLQSGPAGGMLAAAYMAEVLGHRAVLTADMGGTSFDVGVCADGYWGYAEEPVFARFRLLQPVIDVRSIGAGGGTIARADAVTGSLIVGPDSAGASPGPVCYRKGGSEPTVTDANLVLGLVDPAYFLGGSQPLDAGQALEAFRARISGTLALDPPAAALGVHDVINAKMADLVRQQVISTGFLPEQLTLYAFGGASGCHVAEIAQDLGISEVYLFTSAAVFSAFGIAVADLRRSRVRSCNVRIPAQAPAVSEALAALEAEIGLAFEKERASTGLVRVRRFASLRFERQATGLAIEVPAGVLDARGAEELVARFVRRYDEVYGPGAGKAQAGVEVYELRVDGVVSTDKPKLAGLGGISSGPSQAEAGAPKASRDIATRSGVQKVDVYEWRDLRPGQSVPGAAVIESELTTVWVPAGWRADIDESQNVALRSATT